MKQQLKFRLLAVLLLVLPCSGIAHKAYDRMVVFGDSLSDPGNAYYLLGNTLTPPYSTLGDLLIPKAPYAIGGNRFSNGPTWVERLADALGLRGSAGPAFNGAGGGKRAMNYAVGGARARDNGVDFNLPVQVLAYLSAGVSDSADEYLYIVEFGGNDVRDAIEALGADPSGATSAEIVTAALTSIADNVLVLYTSGAREFMLTNSADLSLTPAIRIQNSMLPGSAIAAALVSVQFNMGYAGIVSQLETVLPDIEITKFDIYAVLHELVENPEKYHLTNVIDACIMPDIAPYKCSAPKHYLFWDGIHPTRTGHRLFAAFARKALLPDDAKHKPKRRHRGDSGRHRRSHGH